jgi:hypothetical protein
LPEIAVAVSSSSQLGEISPGASSGVVRPMGLGPPRLVERTNSSESFMLILELMSRRSVLVESGDSDSV